MKCEKCGAEIKSLLVNTFDRYGADYYSARPIYEPASRTTPVLAVGTETTAYVWRWLILKGFVPVPAYHRCKTAAKEMPAESY